LEKLYSQILNLERLVRNKLSGLISHIYECQSKIFYNIDIRDPIYEELRCGGDFRTPSEQTLVPMLQNLFPSYECSLKIIYSGLFGNH